MEFTSEILLKRLSKFAINCQMLTTKLSNNEYNRIYIKQLVRSSSSPAANYIEAIEASSSKEFTHKLKVCRKETKESNYWLELIMTTNSADSKIKDKCEELSREGVELVKIFTASIITSERNQKIKNRK